MGSHDINSFGCCLLHYVVTVVKFKLIDHFALNSGIYFENLKSYLLSESIAYVFKQLSLKCPEL
jgi:hypothetical protein